MMYIFEIQKNSNLDWQMTNEKIFVKLYSEPQSPDAVVNNLAVIDGPVDVYCWYEGTRNLCRDGALFMKESIFEPLFALKKDAKLYLYSLKSWDFRKKVTKMPGSTLLGDAINRINRECIECIYSSSFFRYCTQVSEKKDLYHFINEELPKKNWLFKLSESQRKSGTKVADLFNNQSSYFDCIKDLDVCSAYSALQYIEGYYLIQESVKKGLLKQQKKIEIAFVLPNDESKYYQDFPKDIEKMLQLDFGKALADREINITFQFFKYGESLKSRPYIDKHHTSKVKAEEIISYFDFLSECKPYFLKDVIHNLNGVY